MVHVLCDRTCTWSNPAPQTQGSQVVEKYMREIYGERQRGELWGGVVSHPTGSGVRGWGYAPPRNYMQKRLYLVHILCTFVIS